MPSLVPETPVAEVPSRTSDPGLPFETKIFSTPELLRQPWLPELVQVINDGFGTNGGPVEFSKRLHSVAQLREELDESGFTVVAYAAKSDKQSSDSGENEVIGTASVKKWRNDGEWQQYVRDHVESGDTNGSGWQDPCDGNYEIALLTVLPGEKYRKRGIADRLVRVCEQEALRRLPLQGENSRKPVRAMIKVVSELNGPYWLKKGFTLVGQKTCPKGTWDSVREFTLWAMFRESSG